MDRLVVTGNYSDSPLALDIADFLELRTDVSDLVSLKVFANSEFCPRFIPEGDNRGVGEGLGGQTVVICSSSHPTISRNELAMRNMLLARGAKDNGASRVLLLEPDLFYSAQDRGPHRFGALEADRPPRDLVKFNGQPFSSLLYAQLLRTAGVDSVMTVHNHSRKVQHLFAEQFAGDFHNLIPAEVYAHYIHHSDFVQIRNEGEQLVLCAPDRGAEGIVDAMRQRLRLPRCHRLIIDKKRFGERRVSMRLAPESSLSLEQLAGKDILIIDDMVRTGTTIVEACELLRTGNPRRVTLCVTHFYPSQEVRENLNTPALDEILTTSTIPTILNRDSQGRLRRKMAVLKLAQWMSGALLAMLGQSPRRYEHDFYSVDMSSKNPRGGREGFSNKL